MQSGVTFSSGRKKQVRVDWLAFDRFRLLKHFHRRWWWCEILVTGLISSTHWCMTLPPKAGMCLRAHLAGKEVGPDDFRKQANNPVASQGKTGEGRFADRSIVESVDRLEAHWKDLVAASGQRNAVYLWHWGQWHLLPGKTMDDALSTTSNTRGN